MSLHRYTSFLGLLLLTLFSIGSSRAEVKIVTTLPDLAWAAKQIGGEKVSAEALLRGTENAHFVDAVPNFIAKAASADILCSVGLELEVGWLPKVLSRSGNAKIQSGGAGFCETGRSVNVLDKPTGAVDRSMGDVHPFGNPHYWLSPRALAEGSQEILNALKRVDIANAGEYEKNYALLKTKLEAMEKKNAERLKPYSERPVLLEYHQEFAYLLRAYGLKSAGSLEEKPGVPPSAGRIAQMANDAKTKKLKLILATESNPEKTIAKFKDASGLPAVVVPVMSHSRGEPSNYEVLQEQIVGSLLKALQTP